MKVKNILRLIIFAIIAFSFVVYAEETEAETTETISYITSEWAADYIGRAKTSDLIPEKMLDDDLTEKMTRAEAAAIAVQLCEKLIGKELGFLIHVAPVPTDYYSNPYSYYINKAVSNGIVIGTSDNYGAITFLPDLDVTRQDLATIFLRVLRVYAKQQYDSSNKDVVIFGWYTYKYTYMYDINEFSDDELIADYAKEAAYFLSDHGVINGVGEMCFAPADNATKEQAIVMALRMLESFDTLKDDVICEKVGIS